MSDERFYDAEDDDDDSRKITVSKPFSFEENSESEHKVSYLVRRVLSLFKSVRSGSDLTNFQLPPIFNVPKSHLQCFGESVYCVDKDMLQKCNSGESSLERFVAVVAWSISTCRPATFGFAPYNPVLGETHHVSRGSLNVLLEQVSHHPPISALHATDEKENIEMIWCQHASPKFHGTKVDVKVQGKREIKLKNHGETYVMNSPNLLIKFVPPGVDWVGTTRIRCDETDLEAELYYTTSSLLGHTRPHSIRGNIFKPSSSLTLFELDGHWDSTVTIKDVRNEKSRIIYDAKEVICKLKAPVVKNFQGIWQTESALVWSGVSKGILSKEWDKAREAKKDIEEKQRELVKKRNRNSETWSPKNFTLTQINDFGWDCSPTLDYVPPAPLVVPI